MNAMTKTQSRYVALSLLVLGTIAVIWLLCYPLVSFYVSQSALIERKEGQIARYRQVSENQEALEQELALLKRRSPAASYYVAGETSALASAKMQQYLKQIVQRNGGELISTQVLKEDEPESAGSTSLRVHLRAELESSWQILYVLESGRPLLFLDNIVISARPVRGRKVTDAPIISLDMNFDVTGYLREGA
jgi:general secretion pathway protein M